MKVLLNPRASAAYGQDLLAAALKRSCNLTVLQAGESGYETPPADLELVVSMNLDEKADSDYLANLPENVPVVAHIHCQPSYYSPAQNANLAAAVQRVRIGISPARFHQHQLQELYPTVDWKLVYNGVDRARFRVARPEERNEFRKKAGIDEELTLAIFVGRLEDAKGLRILEQFCNAISQTRLALMLQFLSNSSKTAQRYTEIAARLKAICPNRIFPWPDKDLAVDRPVRHADFLLMPSLCEVCPLVVLEAFVAGIRVIGTHATPFYDELDRFGLPPGSYTFISLPESRDFKVERKNLLVSEAEAKELATRLIQQATSKLPAKQSEREVLSKATLRARFDEETMLGAFRSIYDSVSI